MWLGCGDRLVNKLQPGVRWDVRFTVSLYPAKHMHRAVRLAQSLKLTAASLFPGPTCLRSASTRSSLDYYSPLVAANPEQRAAVEAIVSGLSGSAPVNFTFYKLSTRTVTPYSYLPLCLLTLL